MRAKRIIKIGVFVLILALFAFAALLFFRPEAEDPRWEFVLDGRTYRIQELTLNEIAEDTAARQERMLGETDIPGADAYIQAPEEILEESLPDDLTEVGTLQWTKDEPAADLSCSGPKTLDGAQVYTSAENPGYAWMKSGEIWYFSTWTPLEGLYSYCRVEGRYYLPYPDEQTAEEKALGALWQDAVEREDLLETAQLAGTARLVGDLAGYCDRDAKPYFGPEEELVLATNLLSGEQYQAGYEEEYAGAQFWMVEEYPNILLLRYNDGSVDAFWRYGELPPDGA